jgi:hypothetical protein
MCFNCFGAVPGLVAIRCASLYTSTSLAGELSGSLLVKHCNEVRCCLDLGSRFLSDPCEYKTVPQPVAAAAAAHGTALTADMLAWVTCLGIQHPLGPQQPATRYAAFCCRLNVACACSVSIDLVGTRMLQVIIHAMMAPTQQHAELLRRVICESLRPLLISLEHTC